MCSSTNRDRYVLASTASCGKTLSCIEQVGAWYMRCGNVVLSSIGVSLALIVVAQYTINVVLVLRPSFTVTNLSQPAAPVTAAAAASPSPRDHRHSWTLAQLPSVFRRRVLEYFNPGTISAPTERPRPLCPLPGKLTGYLM